MRQPRLLTVLCLALGLAAQAPAGAVPVGQQPRGIAVNPLTNKIYVADLIDNALYVMDGRTDTVTIRIAPVSSPLGVAVNPETNRAYVSSLQGLVYIVDGATDAVVKVLNVGGSPWGIGVNPTTNRVYVADAAFSQVIVIDGATDEVSKRLPAGNSLEDLDVNPVTNKVYVANDHPPFSVVVIDGVRDEVVASIPLDDQPAGLGVNPATNRVYVCDQNSDTGYSVWIIDGATDVVSKRISFGIPMRNVAVDASAALVYLVGADDAVYVLDGGTDEFVARKKAGKYLYDAAANPKTHRVYVGNLGNANVSVLLEDELLKNPSFESGPGSAARGWRGKNLAPYDGRKASPTWHFVYDGQAVFELFGTSGVDKRAVQVTRATAQQGATLHAEGFSRSDNASRSGRYEIEVRMHFADGTETAFSLGFRRGSHDWERAARSFTVPKAVDQLTVSLIYADQTGQAWFDALHLWISPP